jgi:hypothetical protein
MSSLVTSLAGLFAQQAADVLAIERIEIPLIQRDFAQGRSGGAVTRIRENFLDVLHQAATGGEQAGLDFVYGEVTDGTLRPLDGQQRLTTLFLLHWYVASCTGQLEATDGWAHLTYATRPGARRFCERLVRHALPAGTKPSVWIRDQPWYLYVWRHDPTVQSMLVMLDAIHARFAHDDLAAVWARLVDPIEPAISFHLLPIGDMGSAEELYIKMNSRGKPLTEFETFKAQLHKALDGCPRAEELAERLDGRWADVMWPLRGYDNLFDDEYLNYIRYIVEMCEWRQGVTGGPVGDEVARAERAFELGNPGSAENLDFLFDAFDVWIDGTDAVVDSAEVFDGLLTTASTPRDIEAGRVVVFGDIAAKTNLFEACCASQSIGSRRSLLLYAVLLHRIHDTDDFPRRLRVVRNLIEASTNEIRAAAMPRLVADVARIVVEGDLESVQGFNTEQRVDEIAKRALLVDHPEIEHELFHLEDHEILRGCLMAFDYDAETFAWRAKAFRAMFSKPTAKGAVSGALLAVGDYSRELNAAKHRFGPPMQSSNWRELLAVGAPSRAGLANTRAVLGDLLDRIDPDGAPIGEQLAAIQGDWLAEREAEQRFDWRYYLVKYPAMRQGASGIYATPAGPPGFSLCMLEGSALNGYYRDPFLLAVAREGGAQGSVVGGIEHRPDGPWFTGPASTPRWMRLVASSVGLRCVAEGFVVQRPTEVEHQMPFDGVCAEHGLVETGDEYLLDVPRELIDGSPFDICDRVQIGAALLADLVAAGL